MNGYGRREILLVEWSYGSLYLEYMNEKYCQLPPTHACVLMTLIMHYHCPNMLSFCLHPSSFTNHFYKGKGKAALECLLAEPVTQMTRFSMPQEPGFGIMPLSSTLSQLIHYPLCRLALTNTTNNPSEMCPLKLTYFCLFLYHRSYTFLHGPLVPPNGFPQVVMTGAQTCYPQMGEPAL